MNKKIMIGSILAVLMLVAISFSAAAAVSSQSNDVEKKKAVSPLFGIRTKDAIGEKISSFKAKFLEGRVFLNINIKSLIENIVNKALPSCDDTNNCCTEAWTNCPKCEPRTESGFTCGGYFCIK